jgi:RND superfamily putative drug exporter
MPERVDEVAPGSTTKGPHLLGTGDLRTRRGRLTRGFAWVVAGPAAPVVIVLWVVVVVLLQTSYPVASSEQSVGSIVPADIQAVTAEERSVREIGIPTLSRTVVVQRDAEGLSRNDQRDAVSRAVRVAGGQLSGQFPRLRLALPVINERSVLPVAREDETAIVTYLFFEPGTGWNDQRNAALEYSSTLPGGEPSAVGVTGLIPARIVQDEAILGRLHAVEAATVAVIALIVGFAFRSLVAPLVTMAAGGVAYISALKAVTWAGSQLGFPTPPELRPLMVVLLLGIVTDYVVFLLSGVRHHLAAGSGRSWAARAAVEEYGPVIVTAGLMVAAGAGVLVLASTRIFRAFGPGMAFTVLVGLLAAITLAPAILSVLGRLAFWPAPPRPRPGRGAGAAEPPRRRPGLVVRLVAWRPTAAVVVVLAVAALTRRMSTAPITSRLWLSRWKAQAGAETGTAGRGEQPDGHDAGGRAQSGRRLTLTATAGRRRSSAQTHRRRPRSTSVRRAWASRMAPD